MTQPDINDYLLPKMPKYTNVHAYVFIHDSTCSYMIKLHQQFAHVILPAYMYNLIT